VQCSKGRHTLMSSSLVHQTVLPFSDISRKSSSMYKQFGVNFTSSVERNNLEKMNFFSWCALLSNPLWRSVEQIASNLNLERKRAARYKAKENWQMTQYEGLDARNSYLSEDEGKGKGRSSAWLLNCHLSSGDVHVTWIITHLYRCDKNLKNIRTTCIREKQNFTHAVLSHYARS